MKIIVFATCMVALGGCAKSATMPLSADTMRITTSAAPVCGSTGAQSVAFRRTAVETIHRGYDKFVILGGEAHNNVGVVGYTPVQANTTGSATATGYGNMAVAHGHSTTTYSGGQPIIAGTHDQGLIVKMFKDGDPAGQNALSAREQLGPKWQEAVKESGSTTCF
jgi:hypothetical protein